jgi:uncharacterized protein (TIGR02270 family)
MNDITKHEAFSPAEISASQIEVVLAQHADNAAFLWRQRDAAAREPHFALADLVKWDNRVEAHLDGLRGAGDAGWDIGWKPVEDGGAGEVFTAAVLALESGREDRSQAVVRAGTAAAEKSRGLVSALGWLPYASVSGWIRQLGTSNVPAQGRVGIAAAAVHRQDLGSPLMAALLSNDLSLKARACRAVGELGAMSLHPTVRKFLLAEDLGCRFWSAWSSALLAPDPNAVGVLISLAESSNPYSARAIQVVLRKMELVQANGWLQKLARERENLRLAVIGAGVLATPEWVPWLIDQMKNLALARVAGESFSIITGVDIAYHDLDRGRSEEREEGLKENPEVENVPPGTDLNLPVPNPEVVRKWWERHQSQFSNGTRYLLGKRITIDGLYQVLRTGRQRQRAAAALELALRQPGKPLFEVRAPGFRQQQLLGQASQSG